MKLFSAVAACLLTAVVMCGGTRVWEMDPTPVNPSQDNLILARHIWGHFWGGGGGASHGGGGGPHGSPPAVTAKTVNFKVPVALASTIVTLAAATNTPTACTITLGNPNGYYDTVPVTGGCNIRVTAAGVTGLKTTHTDSLTVKATNSAGDGTGVITVQDWAVPVIVPRTFTVTPPVGIATLGTITVTNGPYTAGLGACGGCTNYFGFASNGAFTTTALAANIVRGQSLQQAITATNFAGTATGTITVNSAAALPVVAAGTYSVAFPVPANGVSIGQISATGGPTSYAVAGGTCPATAAQCTALFQASIGGALSFKDRTLATASTTYRPTITATNAGGTSAAVAQTVTVGAQALPAPVVSALTFNKAFPVASGANFGTLIASNSPTSFAVISCAGCEGFFTTSGSSLVGVAGAIFAASTAYHPVVTATNPTATSPGVAQTVNIGAVAGVAPTVVANTYPLPFPAATNDDVGLIATTGANAATSYDITSCLSSTGSSCVNFFLDPDANGIMRVANGASIAASAIYRPFVSASNAFGTSAPVQQTVNVGAAPLPAPVVTASVYNKSFPVAANASIGGLVASNSPASFAVTSCAGCTGFFTTQGANLVAVAGANLAASTTYNPVVTATNTTGTSPGVAQTVNIGACTTCLKPTVTAQTYPLAMPTANGNLVGRISATQAPTSYAITGCARVSDALSCVGFFTNPDSAGDMRVAAASSIVAGATYQVVVTATNTFGTSAGVPQTVNVATVTSPPPVVDSNKVFNVPLNTAIHAFQGQASATNNPDFWSLGACTTNGVACVAGTFSIGATTGIITNEQALRFDQTFGIVVNARNAAGTSSGLHTVVVGNGASSAPVVLAQTLSLSTPVTAGVKIAQVVSTVNAPFEYTIQSCAGCTGYFAVSSEGIMTVTPTGAAAAQLNGTTAFATLLPLVRASNSGGASNATYTVNTYADGYAGRPAGAPQFPALLGSARAMATVSNASLPNGRDYQLNDILIVDSGTYTTPAQIKVTSVSVTGEITGMNVVVPGSYTRPPPNPISPTCGNPCHGTRVAVNAQYTVPAANYVKQPPWKVAGIDYAVGPPSTQVYKTPSNATKPACVDIGGTTFTVNADNCIIDGFDFTLNNGWRIYVGCGINNPIIRNNKFLVTPSGTHDYIINMMGTENCTDPPVTAAQRAHSFNSTITNNIFDSAYIHVGNDGIVRNLRGGPIGIFRYNWIRRSQCDLLTVNPAGLGIISNYDVRFNLFEDSGQHDAAQECHADILQTGESTYGGTTASFVFDFNTFKRIVAFPCGSASECVSQGIILDGNTKAPTNAWGLVTARNNTLVAKNFNPAQMNFMIGFSPHMSSGPTTITNNYSDSAPATFGLWNRSGSLDQSRLTYNNNFNMRTGAGCNQNVAC